MHKDEKDVVGISQVQKYTLTAILLGLITGLEVLVLYPPLLSLPDGIKIGLLAVLGVTKFVIVVALFMHLWNDAPIFTGIFTLGMVIGAGTLLALLGLFSYYPLPENAVKAPPLEEIHERRLKERSEGGSHSSEHAMAPWFQRSEWLVLGS